MKVMLPSLILKRSLVNLQVCLQHLQFSFPVLDYLVSPLIWQSNAPKRLVFAKCLVHLYRRCVYYFSGHGNCDYNNNNQFPGNKSSGCKPGEEFENGMKMVDDDHCKQT